MLCIVHIIEPVFKIKGINMRAVAIFLLIVVLSTITIIYFHDTVEKSGIIERK
ncbi:MAG: hypothetical protein LBT51_02025 [Fusobacteriaceae bacterium]|jgi:hypothetical protein|nr:hypothetical protein [Fusobacteriaceae bacterium]